MEDALALRRHVSELFERAALPFTPAEERKRLLSIVIVGGGPTGVEVAAEIDDMIRDDYSKLYPGVWQDAKISVIELQEKILSTYDRAISDYAKERFARAGVDLLLGTKVEGVDDRSVRLVNPQGEKVELPYGACVWCTGIRLNPLASQLQEALPEGSQPNRRAINTDRWLRVSGSDGSIFAIGDASTIEQPRALDRCEELFCRGTGGDEDSCAGELSIEEVAKVLKEASKDYPHLEEYGRELERRASGSGGSGFLSGLGAAGRSSSSVSATLDSSFEENGFLNVTEFRALLERIESGLRALPATAQVARQQGEYVARVLVEASVTGSGGDEIASTVRPFEYNHKGSLAYIGGDEAVMDVPVVGALTGRAAGLGWKGFETLSQISPRSQALVATDWLRSKIFGRDISRF